MENLRKHFWNFIPHFFNFLLTPRAGTSEQTWVAQNEPWPRIGSSSNGTERKGTGDGNQEVGGERAHGCGKASGETTGSTEESEDQKCWDECQNQWNSGTECVSFPNFFEFKKI